MRMFVWKLCCCHSAAHIFVFKSLEGTPALCGCVLPAVTCGFRVLGCRAGVVVFSLFGVGDVGFKAYEMQLFRVCASFDVLSIWRSPGLPPTFLSRAEDLTITLKSRFLNVNPIILTQQPQPLT